MRKGIVGRYRAAIKTKVRSCLGFSQQHSLDVLEVKSGTALSKGKKPNLY